VLEIFLSDVGQAEISVEGAHDMIQHFWIERRDQPEQLLAAFRRRFVTAQRNEARAQRFDGVEHVTALLIAHRIAEQAAQQLDPVAQRFIGWKRHDVILRARAKVDGRRCCGKTNAKPDRLSPRRRTALPKVPRRSRAQRVGSWQAACHDRA